MEPHGQSPCLHAEVRFSTQARYLHDITANLMKKDKKGIWKTILSSKPGRYEYRFLKDGNWENDPACSNCVPNEFGSFAYNKELFWTNLESTLKNSLWLKMKSYPTVAQIF